MAFTASSATFQVSAKFLPNKTVFVLYETHVSREVQSFITYLWLITSLLNYSFFFSFISLSTLYSSIWLQYDDHSSNGLLTVTIVIAYYCYQQLKLGSGIVRQVDFTSNI